MKFTKKYETESDYTSAKPTFILPNVSLVSESSKIYYNPKASIVVGAYLYDDGTTGSTSNSNVVGVCVIPDGLLPDRKARFMSVKGVRSDNTSGGNDEGIIWSSNTSETVLPKQYTQIACVGINEGSGGTITDEVEHAADYGYICSNSNNGNFTALTNPYDSGLKYAYDDEDHHIASPYYTNGVFNSNYSTLYTTGGTSIDNALSDFDGYTNTQILIENSVVAAKRCSVFEPNGYGKGKWYLPAIGELAFIMPRWEQIQTAISNVEDGVQLDGNGYYWSSTEYSDDRAWGLTTTNGSVDYDYGKYNDYYVRAFLAL